MSAQQKPRLATIWLDGCSGCHMSFLDLDARLLDLTELVDIVYSPLIDVKEYPENVDICLVEGAVASQEDLHKIKIVRMRTSTVIALGDCSAIGNVPSLRNPIGVAAVLQRVTHGLQPTDVPVLLPQARPLHRHIKVDLFLPGCPPSADTIYTVLTDLLAGREPDILGLTRVGA